MKKGTVVVGMSGGVDSSVAAWLLKEQGYQVIGVTMEIWKPEAGEEGCGTSEAVRDAKRVAEILEIPHYVMDFKEEFREKVVSYFIESYEKGITPNPCIVCNRMIKWESLLEKSLQLGADYIATGHYSGIERLENGRYALKVAKYLPKDQTYALYLLTQDQLAHTLMPLGGYEKPEIRELAKKAGLFTAEKADSQEICFIPDDDYAGFIERETGKTFLPGNIVDSSGKVYGKHRGIIHYTIGQRKGLGLALPKPAYVNALNVEKNEVVIGDNEELFTSRVTAKNINCMGVERFWEGQEVFGKIRYSHKGTLAKVTTVSENEITVEFAEPVRAVTPGQALVLYQDGYCLGGGEIVKNN